MHIKPIIGITHRLLSGFNDGYPARCPCSDIHLDGDHYHHDRNVNASNYYREMFDRVLNRCVRTIRI